MCADWRTSTVTLNWTIAFRRLLHAQQHSTETRTTVESALVTATYAYLVTIMQPGTRQGPRTPSNWPQWGAESTALHIILMLLLSANAVALIVWVRPTCPVVNMFDVCDKCGCLGTWLIYQHREREHRCLSSKGKLFKCKYLCTELSA